MVLKKSKAEQQVSNVHLDDNSSYQLFIQINANRAADLVPDFGYESDSPNTGVGEVKKSSKKSINPVLVALINKVKRRTSRKLHTKQPSWDDTLLIPLKYNDYCPVLYLTVWDKHKRYKNYMGEMRIHLNEIFYQNSKFSSTKPLQWYKLYSKESYKRYITGSLLLSFSLVVKKKKLKGKDKKRKNALKTDKDLLSQAGSKNSSKVKVTVSPSADDYSDLYNKMETLEASDAPYYDAEATEEEKQKMYQQWIKSLIYSNPDPSLIHADIQGFYPSVSDLPPMASDLSDLDSIEASSKSQESKEVSNEGSKDLKHSIITKSDQVAEKNSSKDFLSVKDNLSNVSDENSSILSEVSSLISKENVVNDPLLANANLQSSPPHKKNSNSKNTNAKFSVSNRDVAGVLFLEIVSCSDLPPLRNVTRTSFDVDPFVVIAFGKKTYRTSWKRHTLNPLFNERIVLEVLLHETNFNIQFSVLDKDRFSFHDNIAAVSVPVKDITDMATPRGSHFLNLRSPLEAASDSVLDYDSPSQNSSITVLEDDNLIQQVKKKKFRKKITTLHGDTSKFRTINLALKLHNEKYEGKYNPQLKIRVRFELYENLRRQFWNILLEQYHVEETGRSYDYIELISLLDTLGCQNSDDIVNEFFQDYQKLPWGGAVLTFDEIIDSLEKHITSSEASSVKLFEIEKCPLCCQKRLTKKQDIDIVTHVALCASKDWSIVNKLLVSSYISPQIATKRWFSKLLIKMTYGKYQLGGNSANILVQDRLTGIILEEKMGVHVRLGIRLLYNGLDKAKSKRVRILLKKMSIKQGAKFDSPQLKNDIQSFIKFHKLDMSDCLEPDPTKYATFNDFFYRKLKEGARPLEAAENRNVVVSPTDCRCTAFTSVKSATRLWIKGRNFSVAKLFNGNFNNLEHTDLYEQENCSIGIFRLAPQDYHRFHSPVDGKITKIKHIEGEYYTVNPMAIRSKLDVFGENVRILIEIETKEFGPVVMVAVGAMMVGSIVLTKGENETVSRGEEVGYFKFGGSTILLLFQSSKFSFDSYLINNSNSCIETLLRVGQSVGHSPDTNEYKRPHLSFEQQSDDFKLNLIRMMTGGDLNDSRELNNWEIGKSHFEKDDIESILRESDEGSLNSNENGDDFDSIHSGPNIPETS
ncbi:uncharacterized protein PRCAT00000332001 [Priceomyces carsonii]|uniref:uncharacterized protein n=1 Tax=Priceomyces carsonii TaxID=28549 RepID=UPI002EDADB9B|nr:unnamed protein product [Priceomyces carsonii]